MRIGIEFNLPNLPTVPSDTISLRERQRLAAETNLCMEAAEAEVMRLATEILNIYYNEARDRIDKLNAALDASAVYLAQ